MNVDKHYNNYIEDGRLEKDLQHKTEFILTNYWIDKYLKKGMNILEIGAGTGTYSIMFAKKGYQVDSLELVQHNLDILKSKITSDMNIKAIQGNALDMSMYNDNTFDVVLCLGPLYHLENKNRKKCIEEAIRVCKPNGYLFFAYISNCLTFVQAIDKYDNYLLESRSEFNDKFELRDNNNVFTYSMPEQIEKIMQDFNIIKLNHVSLDGVTRLIKNKVNSFSKEEFELWINYLKATSEIQSILGYSEHIMYIGKKQEN